MVQVTEKELTEDTQRYLSLLETQSGKVIFFGMLKDLFGWKGFYPGNERLGDGALVTLRNSLRLVSSRQDRSLEKYSMASIPIFADYLVELLKSTDGYFGKGLNTVRCDLHMQSTQELCSRIRENERCSKRQKYSCHAQPDQERHGILSLHSFVVCRDS